MAKDGKSGFQRHFASTRLSGVPNHNVRRIMQHPCKTPAGFLQAEAQGNRIRQRNSALPGENQEARLKARITLPTVKGYWE